MNYNNKCNFCYIEDGHNEHTRHRYLCKKHSILLGKNTYEPPDLREFMNKNKQGRQEINNINR
jgi:hypothetical protein